MSTNVEIESKALVTEEEYLKILNYYLPLAETKPYIQTNYYIDTPDFELRKNGSGLRIRIKGNEGEMTLKVPLSYGLLEKNQDITLDDFNEMKDNHIFPEGNIKEFLIMLGYDIDSLKIYASLTTKRLDYRYKESKLSIDRNEYNGKVDYEIEMENSSPVFAKRDLIEVLEEQNIEYKENLRSKTIRASEM